MRITTYRLTTVAALFLCLALAALCNIGSANTLSSLTVDMMKLRPLAFTENQGQWDERVKFRVDAGGATMWFTTEGTYYQFIRTNQNDGDGNDDRSLSWIPEVEQLLIKATLVGSSSDPEFVGESPMKHTCNYFIGDDPDKWFTDVPSYESVLMKDVYSGIDLKYYGSNGLMEYDFILSPGADPSQIEICYEGAESVSVDDFGQLVVETEWNTVVEKAPIIYQACDDGEFELAGKYVLLSDNTFGFQIDEQYDDAYAVVIDPVLTYGTYLGGSGSDQAKDVAIDGSGNIIIAGATYSSDFPLVNEYQSFQGYEDFFVAKYTNSGDALIYSTCIGGDSTEVLWGLDADDTGNAYVTGLSISTNYPTHNAYQTDQGGHDGVVTKLNDSGNGLVYSTYLGGNGPDYPGGIAVGPDDNAYVTGKCGSSNFPLLNSYHPAVTFPCLFVTRFDNSGTALVYSSVIVGDGGSEGNDIVVDDAGCAYVTGYTGATDYATVNAFQTDQPGVDGFLTKFYPEGSDLHYSTYLGGDDYDMLNGIALYDDTAACVTGYTTSSDFPTIAEYQLDQPGQDAIVAFFNATGQPIYSTYLGGDDMDEGEGVDIDDEGNAYVTGHTLSGDFPLVDPFDASNNNLDVFVTKIEHTGAYLIYSTFVAGTTGSGYGFDIRLDQNGYACVTGGSNNLRVTFPATLNPTPSGGSDAYLIKIKDHAHICGDANASGGVDIDDVVFLIAYIFSGGPAPIPYESGDANCSGGVDIDDVVWLIAYVFSGGNAPCDTDGDGTPDC